jgi:hypothetical protein
MQSADYEEDACAHALRKGIFGLHIEREFMGNY